MIFPKHGDKVRIVLSSGIVKDGVIDFWAEDDERGLTWTSLKPLENSDESFMIQNYWIAGFLIIKETIKPPIKIEENILNEPITDHDLRLKNLAELRKIQTQSERQQIKKLLKRTDIRSVKETNYVLPNFLKKRTDK